MQGGEVTEFTGATCWVVGHVFLLLVTYYFLDAVSTRDAQGVERLRTGQGRLRRRVTRSRALLRSAGGSIGDRLSGLTLLANRVRREEGCVDAVRDSIRALADRVTSLRGRLGGLRHSLGSGGQGCRASIRCVCHGGSIRRGLVFVFSTRGLDRACHHVHCIRRCTGFRHLRKVRVRHGRGRVTTGGERIRRAGRTGRGLLGRNRIRGTGLRVRRGRHRALLTGLRGGRGNVRDRVEGGGHSTRRLGTRVSHLVRVRVRGTEGHTRRRTHEGTTTRTTTGTTTTGGTRHRAAKKTSHSGSARGGRSAGGITPIRGFDLGGRSHRLSNDFRHGQNVLPIPVANPCIVIDRCKRCTMSNLHGIGLSGGKVSVGNGPKTRTHTIFGKRISTVFRCGNLGGVLIHRNGCVSICYGLSSMSISGNDGIGAHAILNAVRASDSNGAILRFRLHGRATGLGPRL